MTHPQTPLCKRIVRWHQLRQIVSLADITIYDMEQRGGRPRMFCLTSPCVV
ncbi:AlpA family phage regulatory protein [Rhizobium sp. E27B/91]|nr:AlpA family phage regulatory protein [Rhizobium sp. E27B/91]